MSDGSWPSPQSPLSPDRLAKIANALGVSTPTPLAPSRSPPSTSSYLVHVVPPLSLPHLNTSLTSPPPPSATGYHNHFRRGILLPVHATLQLQLAAIAREYALPSTIGLMLYLIQDEDPGPRISDDIWKHLWARVWKAEFAPDAPDKLPTLKLNAPRSEQDPSLTRPSSLVDNKSPEKSLVPIVAKVEFDVDARAALWFNPWMTSRNLNYSKRMEGGRTPVTLNLPRTPRSAHSSTLGEGEDEDFAIRPAISRNNVPPRLALEAISSTITGTGLAYLQQPDESDEDTEIDDEAGIVNGKRVGGVYDDFELDFAETEESQYLMTAKLDQIEKDLAQFSPRVLHVDLSQEHDINAPIRTDLSPPIPTNSTTSQPIPPNQPLPSSTSTGPSPPRLALNGIATAVPNAFNPTASGDPSAEAERRRRLEQEEWGQYPRHTPRMSRDSVIPLSPDPFSRHPSNNTPPLESRASTYWEDSSATVVNDSETTSSRFSADSLKGENANNNRATIMSAKSIKRLWRRSSKQSINMQQLPTQGRLSPNGETTFQQHRSSGSTSSNRSSLQQQSRAGGSSSSSSASGRPKRPITRPPSLHNFDIPDVADAGPNLPPHVNAIGLDRMRFDQESPYPNPTRRPRPPVDTYGPSPTSSNGKSSPTPSVPGSENPVPVPPQEPQNQRSGRKSIFKWKSGGSRSRTTSTLNVNNEKMPPSPMIPEQFLQQQGATMPYHASGKSQSSMAPSMVSSGGSRYSEDEGRGPSIDEGQFEIVSPKMAPNSLSYPYTTVDRE